MVRALAVLVLVGLLPAVSAGGLEPALSDVAGVAVQLPMADASVSPDGMAVRVDPLPPGVGLLVPDLLGPQDGPDGGSPAPAPAGERHEPATGPLPSVGPAGRAAAGVSLAAGLAALGWAVLRLAGFAPWLPFFSRIDDGRVAEHPARRRALDFIQDKPGATVREVQAALGLAWGTTVHHLRRLEHAGLLAVRRDGGQVGHWPLGQAPPRDGLSSALRGVAALVKSSPGLAQKEIARITGVGASAACKRLAALEEAGLVAQVHDGRSRLYVPTGKLLALDVAGPAIARPGPPAPTPSPMVEAVATAPA